MEGMNRYISQLKKHKIKDLLIIISLQQRKDFVVFLLLFLY